MEKKEFENKNKDNLFMKVYSYYPKHKKDDVIDYDISMMNFYGFNGYLIDFFDISNFGKYFNSGIYVSRVEVTENSKVLEKDDFYLGKYYLTMFLKVKETPIRYKYHEFFQRKFYLDKYLKQNNFEKDKINEICEKCVKDNGRVISCIKDQSDELCILAIKENLGNIRYVRDEERLIDYMNIIPEIKKYISKEEITLKKICLRMLNNFYL
jgi:hypothetical protein